VESKSAWIPRNNALVGIAQATEFEFIANNPGDWMFHCHMMNHMTRHIGPPVRQNASVDEYLANVDLRSRVDAVREDPGFSTPGYPQEMKGMNMSDSMMKAIWNRRELQGMRARWSMSIIGLMTALRVSPEDLYHSVMETNDEISKGAIFEEIVRRFGRIAVVVNLPRAKGAPFALVTPSDTQPVCSNCQREHFPITRRLAKVLPTANTCRSVPTIRLSVQKLTAKSCLRITTNEIPKEISDAIQCPPASP